jgi:MerR family transcriptional regulator, light-induced transcriptional regulator
MNPADIKHLKAPSQPAHTGKLLPPSSTGQGSGDITWNITSVERDTGISKDTLRMWERRYSFPMPIRDYLGERQYPLAQVEKLRIVKRLMDLGHRPGKLAPMDMDSLRQLAQSTKTSPKVEAQGHVNLVEQFLALIKTHQIEAFRRGLTDQIVKNGIAATVKGLVAPLTYAIGEAWREGDLEIYEEHLFTESLHVVLRNAIHSVPRQTGHTASHPKVLLTTLPQEPHGLGLLMAEAMYALEGCATLSLGTQTPMWDIVQAATRQHMDVVALSFSVGMNRQQVQDGLRELRHQLAPNIEIWAGGASTALNKYIADGVICTQRLEDIGIEVKRWRTLHGQIQSILG